MQTCETILHAHTIITQDEASTVLQDASVAIDHGTIVAIGPAEEIARSWTADEYRDFPDSLMMPGLINAHTHVSMTFLRGFADDMQLMEWLEQKIFPKEAHLTSEIVSVFSLLGFAEMLATGTTACLDMYLFEDAVLEAARTAGIRIAAGEGVFAFPTCSTRSWQAALEQTEALAEKYAGDPRCSVVVCPHSIYTTTDEILAATLDLAGRHGLPVHIHLAESTAETEKSLELHGMRPVPYLQSMGYFTHPCTIAHLVDCTDEDLACLEEAADLVAVHNPSSNLKLASGISPVPSFLDHRIPVALGTDGPASNNQLNMFLEMRLAALLHKAVSRNPSCVPAGTVLDMATRNGARALHTDRLGALAPGYLADLIILDERSPNMMPCYAPVSQVVYATSGHEVVFTMVHGTPVYDHGAYPYFDYTALCGEVRRLTAYIREKM